MDIEAEALLEVGTVVGTHGLRGDLKIRLNSGDPDVLKGVRKIQLRQVSGNVKTVDICRNVLHKRQLLLRFAGYESINLIDEFNGAVLLLRPDDLPGLGRDEYYWGELSGLEVVDRKYGCLGHVEDMLSTGAHDTYVVNGFYGEVLIPAVKQFVKNIDLETGVMAVELPDGLVPEGNDEV